MLQSPLEAYQQVEKVTGSGREIEAAVLTKAAMKLRACQKNWDAHDRDARLEEALKFNQKVWSIFQSELTNENHPMPPELRRNLLRLGGFIDRRIFETMANPTPEKLDMVIKINCNLAAGLRGSTIPAA